MPDAVASTDADGSDDAVAWFRRRVPLTDDEFYALNARMRRRAFTVSGVASLDMVTAVQRSLERAIRTGQTFEEWKKTSPAELRKAWGKRRAETIFRTNVQAAYSAARWKQLTAPAVLRARPFWMFDAVLDGRTTPTCSSAHGTVLPATDEWWQTHTPPMHFSCRSGIRSLRAAQAERRGITGLPPQAAPQSGFGLAPSDDEWKPERSRYAPDMWEIYRRKHPTRWGDPPPSDGRKPPWAMRQGDAPGELDETARRLEPDERRTADVLVRDGNRVQAIRESAEFGERTPDTRVNGRKVELKTLGDGTQSPADRIIKRVLESFARGGQADSIVFDVRGSGMPEELALRTAARLRSRAPDRLSYLRIIGDDFDLTFWDF